MIYDLMPGWLRRLLGMEAATLRTVRWTWRHACRYGADPANLLRDEERYRRSRRFRGLPPRGQEKRA